MEVVRYILHGDPIPLMRARHGNRKTWDAQKHIKLALGLMMQEQHRGKKMYCGPLHLDVDFYFVPPQRRNKDHAYDFHIFRPDLSNLIKLVEDVATGILFSDDCIIASLSAKKKYDNVARTEFTISRLN